MSTRPPLLGAGIVLKIRTALSPLPLLLCLIPLIAHAQIYDFKSYTVREGLLSNAITSLCQDSRGYLWIGTGDGLSVYDGETFKNYSAADGLSSSLVNCVMEDINEKGVIWIGTNGGGLCSFRSGRFRTLKLGRTDWSNRVNSVAEDEDGTLFCATDDGVYRIAGGVASPISSVCAHGTYNQIVCDGDSLFILVDNGKLQIFNLADGSITSPGRNLYPQTEVSRICIDNRHQVWLALADGSLMNISESALFKGVGKPYPKFLINDGNGNLWMGTTNGIFGYERNASQGNSVLSISTKNGLPENDVSAGLVDREGDLWIGTSGKGLVKLADRNSYEFPIEYGGVPANNSQAGVDGAGHVWVAAVDGVLEIWKDDIGGLRKQSHPYSEMGIKSACNCVQVVAGNQLWLASTNGHVFQYRIITRPGRTSALRRVKSFSMKGVLPGKILLCMYIDNSGRGWYSRDLGGVLEFNTDSGPRDGRVYTTKDGLPDNSIRAIFRDKDGNMWFGGYIGGLARLEKDADSHTMKLYTTKDGLPDNSIRAITQDDSGNIWVGTRYGGVAVKTETGFLPISVKDGLVSDGVWCMDYDRHFGMVLGTQLGIQVLEKSDWRSKNWRSFGDATPVFSCGSDYFSTGDRQVHLLWACNPLGIFLTDLSRPSVPKVAPLVYITGLLVNGNEYRLDSSVARAGPGIRLQYSENTLTFDFAGISLRDEGGLSYRYMLHGVDRDWHVLSRRLPVTYATLSAGKYIFEVKAVNSAGVESRDVATLPFVIVPPFWLTWWFMLISAFVFLSIVYLSIRSKVRRMLEIERVRSRIATDLHDDIGSGLTRIAILADVALRQTASAGAPVQDDARLKEGIADPFSTNNLVHKIAVNARELVDSMSDVVWSIDPKNVTIGDLITRFRSFAYEMCEAKGIRLDVDIDKDIETLRLDPGVMRTLLLIAKEALNNSARHSGCKYVRVGIKAGSGEMRFLFADDGCGFASDRKSSGHGLENMRLRAGKLGGGFNLRSSPGDGTVIEISVPLGR
jgi:ligand-binding sensor domain-containing protein/signal transduction histidine kinase